MGNHSLFKGRCVRARHLTERFARPQLEYLEDRWTPYAASGSAWVHPELITLSFMPDGTDVGGVYTDLFTQFNSWFGSPSTWQAPFLKAAQAWAQQTNLNFTVINDDGTGMGAGAYQQGDSNEGDIRFGGYDFFAAMGDPYTLAYANMPPPLNNYSIAGDITFNTYQVWNINGVWDYDVFSVAAHEIGHALGLGHSSLGSSVMYPYYNGLDTGLGSDDIAGIRSIYSGGLPRSPDVYDAAASNGTFATAKSISSLIDPQTLTAQTPELDVTTTSDLDYFKVVVPAGNNGQMTISLQSQGVSLLAPNLRVYNSAQTQLYTGSGTGYTGSTVSFTRAVSTNQTYYIRVDGANTTSFGTGAYVLSLKFGTAPLPPVVPPNTQILDGSPLSAGGFFGDTIPSEENEAFDGFSASPGRHGHGPGSVGAPGRPEDLVASVWAALQEDHRGVRVGQDSDATPANADHGLGRLRTTLSSVDTRNSAQEDEKDTPSDVTADGPPPEVSDFWFTSIGWMSDLLNLGAD